MKLHHEEITDAIIGAAFEVYNVLLPLLPEVMVNQRKIRALKSGEQ